MTFVVFSAATRTVTGQCGQVQIASLLRFASVFVHDLPIVYRRDGQKQNVISEGDAWLSAADNRHSSRHMNVEHNR